VFCHPLGSTRVFAEEKIGKRRSDLVFAVAMAAHATGWSNIAARKFGHQTRASGGAGTFARPDRLDNAVRAFTRKSAGATIPAGKRWAAQ